jgi:hypothetical protein
MILARRADQSALIRAARVRGAGPALSATLAASADPWPIVRE